MKTNYLLSILAGVLFFSCSSDESKSDETGMCMCKKVHYEYTITGWTNNGATPVWGYVKGDEEAATERDCSDDTGEYVQIDENDFYKIECE